MPDKVWFGFYVWLVRHSTLKGPNQHQGFTEQSFVQTHTKKMVHALESCNRNMQWWQKSAWSLASLSFLRLFAFSALGLHWAREQNAKVWNWEDCLWSYKKDILQMKMPQLVPKAERHFSFSPGQVEEDCVFPPPFHWEQRTAVPRARQTLPPTFPRNFPRRFLQTLCKAVVVWLIDKPHQILIGWSSTGLGPVTIQALSEMMSLLIWAFLTVPLQQATDCTWKWRTSVVSQGVLQGLACTGTSVVCPKLKLCL